MYVSVSVNFCFALMHLQIYKKNNSPNSLVFSISYVEVTMLRLCNVLFYNYFLMYICSVNKTN